MTGVALWPTDESITFHVRKIMETLAPFCKAAEYPDDLYEELNEFAHPDYKMLGAGGSRVTFLVDGFAVKIEYYRFVDSEWPEFSSENEFENYTRIVSECEIPAGWAITPMRLYYVDDMPIIVSQYVSGSEDPSGYSYEFNRAVGLTDCLHSNVLISEGVRWVVDLGQ